MAHIAHTVANIMIVLISLATLITLGRSTGEAFLASVQAGHPDYMKGIALLILFFLVVSMDTAVLYGSNMIRTLVSRGANEKLLIAFHSIVVTAIAALEGLTYWIMILTYEHPTNDLEYHVGQARAFGAPAIAIYLSLAAIISITKADILNIGAVQSGIVSVQKVSDLAGQASTPLHQTWRIFDAAAGPSRVDGRINSMIQAVTWEPTRQIVDADTVPHVIPSSTTPTPAPVGSSAKALKPAPKVTTPKTAVVPVRPTAVVHVPAPASLDGSQKNVLANQVGLLLAEEPGMGPGAIAQKLHITPFQASQAMAAALRLGMVASV